MKVTIAKLAAFFDMIYLLVTVIELIIISTSVTATSVNKILSTYGEISGKVLWVAAIGLILHMFAYICNLRDNWALFGHMLGIFAYLILLILPKFFMVGVVLLIISIIIIMRRNRKSKIVTP